MRAIVPHCLIDAFAQKKKCQSAANPHFLFLFINSTSFPYHFSKKSFWIFFNDFEYLIYSTCYSYDDVTGQLVPFSAIARSWTWSSRGSGRKIPFGQKRDLASLDRNVKPPRSLSKLVFSKSLFFCPNSICRLLPLLLGGRSRGERSLASLRRSVKPASRRERSQPASSQKRAPDKDTSVGRHNQGKTDITALARACAKGVRPIRDLCPWVTPQCLQMTRCLRCLSMSEPLKASQGGTDMPRSVRWCCEELTVFTQG